MYYYAVLNTKDIVEYISEQENEVTYYEYISIPTADQSLVGKWYDREGVYGTVGAFLEVPISIQAEHSSSQISYKGQDVWLDEKLDSYATQSELSSGLAGKANASHFHDSATQFSSGYMSSGDKAKLDGIEANANLYVHPETHAASMITGISDVAKSGSYNDLTDKPTIPTIPTALPADGGNADTLDGYHATYFAPGQHNHDAVYATANHTHNYAAMSHTHEEATTSTAGFMSATDKAKLNGIASGANSYTHPASHPASMITETDSLKVMTAAERTKLSGIAENANNYTHPETHSAAIIEETSLKKVMTAEERTKLAGIESGANLYTHPSTHPATMITGLPTTLPANGGNADTVDGKHAVDFATASHNHDSDYSGISHTHAQSDITGLSTALSGKSDTSHTHGAATTTVAGFMSKDDKSKLDGIATGANKTTVDTALSSTSTNPVQNKVVNTALAGKASTSHNHNSAYIAKSLQMTADDGDVLVSWTNQDVVAKIKALPTGMYTAYAKAGTTNNPKTTESWRFLVHKTSAVYGWVQAFGAFGSMYIGYVDNSNWKGWKCVYDADPSPLWTGKLYMSGSESSPQTVTPSKKLSECRTGYLLVWSDYDPDTSTANDADFVTTFIPKKNPTGGNWSGKSFLCDIPRYIGSNVNDVDTERRIMKILYIYDNRIVGSPNNSKDDRNDVVLRAVYEF